VAREGFDPVYGARPLKRFLQHELETRIARAIVSGEAVEGSEIAVDLVGGSLTVELKAGTTETAPAAT
jgi:ATP-dependent Clp protease ATP-binding subunit ClpB